MRDYYLPFDSGPRSGSASVYQHEIPGGQYTNLREQAAAMGLAHSWREVERTYAEVNRLFGDIVKVTPSSKVVGDMALFLIAREMRPQDVLKLDEHHDLAFPNSVVEMLAGGLGTPPDGWPAKVQRSFCAERRRSRGVRRESRTARSGRRARRPGEASWPNRSPGRTAQLHLYPDVFLKFDKFRQEYADVSVLPTPIFFFGLRPDQEITVSIEAGKTLVIRFWPSASRIPTARAPYFSN